MPLAPVELIIIAVITIMVIGIIVAVVRRLR